MKSSARPIVAPHQIFVDCRHGARRARPVRRRPRSRSRIARWNRCGIRCSRPIPAACRRRNRRGDTNRHPSRAAPAHPSRRSRVRRQSCARADSPRCSASRANVASVACRNQPSHTLSPFPPSPTRSMPSFQSPVPIKRQAMRAGGEACVERQRAMLEQTSRSCSKPLAERTRRAPPSRSTGPRGMGSSRRVRRDRR